jgi:hypothetical protein
MNGQSEIVGVETLGYRHEGMIYVIHGRKLFQVDHNHFFEFMPGNEVFGSKVRQLKKLTPIPHSELSEILDRLGKLIETIKK